MKKKARQSIKYFLRNAKFSECTCKREINDVRKAEDSNIQAENSDGEERSDYLEDSVVTGITICDVLSNEGVTKLLSKIYSLSKRKFKVECFYLRPKLKKKYSYVHLQYSHTENGYLAQIELLNDKYIESIKISWSQINSYYAFIEYKFTLKKPLDDTSYKKFVCENIKKINYHRDYITWFFLKGNDKEHLLEEMENEYFRLIFQHYITSYLYSKQGKKGKLHNLISLTRKEPIDINKLEELKTLYYNKQWKYIICPDYNGKDYYLFSGGNLFPEFQVCPYISKYGNDFYYRFFGENELKEFELEFSKFVSGRKKIGYGKNIRELLSKTQSVLESENRKLVDFFGEFNKEWIFYKDGNKFDIEKYPVYKVEKIQKIYQDNFSYLKLLTEMQYTKSNHAISIIAIIVAIATLIITA